MKKLPFDTFKLYRDRLNLLGVPAHQQPHYVKWVRYFLDFEVRYGVGGESAIVVNGFIAKLASKGQSVGLRDQARRAVSVFLELDAAPGYLVADSEPVAWVTDLREAESWVAWLMNRMMRPKDF